MAKYQLTDKLVSASNGSSRSRGDINSIIIHTTGSIGGGLLGAVKQSLKEHQGFMNWEDVDDKYAKKLASYDFQAHFLIGWSGKIYQFYDPATISAPHAGGRPNVGRYSDPVFWAAYYDTDQIHPIWKNRWEGVLNYNDPSRRPNPLDFPIWQTGLGLNRGSVGIDLQAFDGKPDVLAKYDVPQGKMTSQQEASLVRLVNALVADFGIPRSRQYILGHSDVDPISRFGMADPAQVFPWYKICNDAGNYWGRPAYAGKGPQLANSTWKGRNNPLHKRRGQNRSAQQQRNVNYIGGQAGNSGNIPFNEFDYLTPEERRKGIIARFFYLSDWYLNRMVHDPESEIEDESRSAVTGQGGRVSRYTQIGKKENKATPLRGDIDDDPRRRYCMALVEAEFYRQKFASRTVPAVVGPFNPYPVAGFPGLILTPERPIMGMVSNVTHTISPASGTAQTTVSFVSPRYWDEGDVWFWYGGNERDSQADAKPYAKTEAELYKKAPQWINRYILATNNHIGGKRIVSRLDQFYLYHLGCSSIEYVSNHAGLGVAPSNITNFITNRDPWKWNLNPDTLAIADVNTAIAGTDSRGNFKRNTLARRFLNISRPTSDIPDLTTNVDKAIRYVERYGVSEEDLFVTFLGNEYYKITGEGKVRLVVAGPTWENDVSSSHIVLSPLQEMMFEYMDEIEDRSLELHAR